MRSRHRPTHIPTDAQAPRARAFVGTMETVHVRLLGLRRTIKVELLCRRDLALLARWWRRQE